MGTRSQACARTRHQVAQNLMFLKTEGLAQTPAFGRVVASQNRGKSVAKPPNLCIDIGIAVALRLLVGALAKFGDRRRDLLSIHDISSTS